MSERKEKWTPGPWIVRDFPYSGGRNTFVVDSKPDVNGLFVGQVIAMPTTAPEWSANQHLIAAAPDLYRALLALVNEVVPLSVEKSKLVYAAWDAIGKAHGGKAPVDLQPEKL